MYPLESDFIVSLNSFVNPENYRAGLILKSFLIDIDYSPCIYIVKTLL